ncbi:hypothetical protein ERC79_17490 [Rhodococcus sp. ABRD24]|uniref:hypothetical protein n=1 Tax=Rhodococcus sp. ABRD24 TaxID=2507582 RepID=UPI001040A2E1|nr:hypothetical protein [Rhodococcus sp. ABRD24]QBJ97534.1 hypothetical protein ERC79_17490 [Rhodococcus sp. ABRD24]
MDSRTQSRAAGIGAGVVVAEARQPAPATSRPAGEVGALQLGAVALAVLSGFAIAAGFLVPVARVESSGAELHAVGAAALVGAAFALAVPAAATVALLARRTALVGGLLAGAGSVAVGMSVLDLQLWTGPIDANRLELFRPLTAAAITAGPGAAVVLIGHVGAAVAGLLGLMVIHRASHADGYGASPDPEASGRPAGSRIGLGLAAGTVASAIVSAFALFAPPLSSADPVIVVPEVLGSGAPAAIGAAFLAVAILGVVAAALAATDVTVAAGAVAGAALALLGLVGARLAGGLAGERLAPGSGTVWGTLSAGALVLASAAIPVVVRRREMRAVAGLTAISQQPRRLAAHERTHYWHVAAGATGTAAGLLAGAGAMLPVLTVPAPLTDPVIPATRIALVAGAVLAVASVWLLLSEFAALVRPAVGVLWAPVVAAATAVVQAAAPAREIPGVGFGAGTWLIALSALAALAAGALAGLAGAAERDDVDTSETVVADRPVLVVGGLAAVTAFVAFALPLYRGSDGTAAALGRFPWGLEAWGQLLLAVTIVAAVVVAMQARPARGAALFAGAAVAIGIHVASWPLVASRLADPSAGPGMGPAILAVVLLVVAAVLAARRKLR